MTGTLSLYLHAEDGGRSVIINLDKLLAPLAWLMLVPFLVLGIGPLLLIDWLGRRFGPTPEWTLWFAWRPVLTDDDKCAWLCTIERKRIARYEDTDYRIPPPPVSP